CCCRFAFAQKKHLLLPLRFRTEKTFVAAASLLLQKTFVAVATLSHRKHPLRCRVSHLRR
ncbi:hypothetical protein, partial [Lysinibacillus sp. NPDC086135]|uniref:hypothetical protein n=1 Tax=Lysinibacillus sp. NPDC086135 TaxID=3364130 RepID=UPI00380342FC